MKILVVTAVEAERDAVRTAASCDVVAVGVGQAAAAAGAAVLLAGGGYDLVISAGIAGGFVGRAAVGDLVIGTRTIAADLGADSPDGFLGIDELGFGVATLPARAAIVGGVQGAILTVNTVTGRAATAAVLAARYPDAVAEAMEGYGVAVAAARHGVPFAEVRAISNPIGDRDRAAWRIPAALAALTEGFAKGLS